MAKIRALVKRRKAIRNIRKITRTMELIATTRFRKTMDRAVQAEAYTRKIAELAADLSAGASNVHHPLLQAHETVKTSLLLVICSNRGLCGGYNSAILREANATICQLRENHVQLQLELSGKRAINFFRFHNEPAAQTFTHFEDKPTFAQVEELANRYIADYSAGRIDRVEVAYMKFHSASKQAAGVETLLPLVAPAGSPRQVLVQKVDYDFYPSAEEILEEILPMSFKVRLFKCFLDAAVSEQIARRVAMKAATENADEIIKGLTRLYNRARQAQITKEIAEVIGGAEALK
jgi:F-type H+-transporting ATPase subunit gamma